jgi:hypothetical protein
MTPTHFPGMKLEKLLKPKRDTGDHNRLFSELNGRVIHALYDLFNWREGGGGIRHVIAHGATWGDAIPVEFCDRCFAISIAMCLQFMPNAEPPSINKICIFGNVTKKVEFCVMCGNLFKFIISHGVT